MHVFLRHPGLCNNDCGADCPWWLSHTVAVLWFLGQRPDAVHILWAETWGCSLEQMIDGWMAAYLDDG